VHEGFLFKSFTCRIFSHIGQPVHVVLAAPIVLNVPDMCSRDEDNILLKTIANTIPLNDYNPTKTSFWRQVTAEIPDHLSQQCRERYMTAAFFSAYFCWSEYRAHRPPPICVYLMTAEISLARPHPPRPYSTYTKVHWLSQPQPPVSD
jgi:hypothetical protein